MLKGIYNLHVKTQSYCIICHICIISPDNIVLSFFSDLITTLWRVAGAGQHALLSSSKERVKWFYFCRQACISMETRCGVWACCGWCGCFVDKSWRWRRLEILKREPDSLKYTPHTECGRDYTSCTLQSHPALQVHKEVSTTPAFCALSTQCPRTSSTELRKHNISAACYKTAKKKWCVFIRMGSCAFGLWLL